MMIFPSADSFLLQLNTVCKIVAQEFTDERELRMLAHPDMLPAPVRARIPHTLTMHDNPGPLQALREPSAGQLRMICI